MSYRHAMRTFLMTSFLAGDLMAAEALLEDGLYEVHFRLELPHLETYAVDRKTTICVDEDRPWLDGPPLPLLSQNDVFSECQIGSVRQDGTVFTYEIRCKGRGAARATAVYVLAAEAFSARVSIMQGGKNMTMTEIQRGRRLGHCD